MRIGIITDSINNLPAGIGVYTENLIRNLLEIDKKNKYFLIHKEASFNPLYQDPRSTEVKYKSLGKYIPKVIQDSLFLSITRLKLDLVHKPTPTAFLFPVNFKKIITVNDLASFVIPNLTSRSYNFCYRLILKHSFKEVDKIIAISDSTKKDLINLFKIDSKKISVIYGAVGKEFKLIKSKFFLEKIRNKYFLPEKFILHVGTFEPRKNLPFLIKAFANLKEKKNISHKLVLVGKKGWRCQLIFDKIKELKIEKEIIVLDYLPKEDLPAIYNLASVFVYPSLYEGFGLPVLETMACGCPVICSNTSSLPEVAGEAAIMIDPYDVDGLVKAMEKVLADENLRESMIQKGLKQVKKFGWEKCAQKTLKIYEEVENSNFEK